MLQRIYGTAWESKQALADHLHQIEEAAKRDHRKLATELDLLSFPSELGGGLAVWHPKGATVRKLMEDYSRAPPRDGRIRVRLHAAPLERAPVRDVGSPRLVRRRHVPADGDGQRHVLHEADELPDALPDLQEPAAQLSRAAAAAVRARQRLPLRAGGHVARPDADPRVHAGRQPHLLSRRSRWPTRSPACSTSCCRCCARSASRSSRSTCRRRTRTSTSAPTRSGTRPPLRCARRSTGTASSTRSRRATPPSTARRSTSTCATRSAGRGSCRPSSPTSTCPSGSTSSTSAPTTTGTGRSCCTARCSGRSSASSACCSSTTRAPSRHGSRRCRCGCSGGHGARGVRSTGGRARIAAAGGRVDMIAADDQLGKRIRSSKMEKIPYILVVGDDDVAAGTVGVNPRGGEVERGVERRRVRRAASPTRCSRAPPRRSRRIALNLISTIGASATSTSSGC